MGKDDRESTKVNGVNGVVTGRILNVATMITYVHDDGRECPRPGPADLALGSLVESEWEIQHGLCEHTILRVHDTTTEPEEKSVTVADILQTRSNLPDDAVSEEVIAKAKIPPKIRRDPLTTPTRMADVPVENRFEFDLDESELREINNIRGIADEPVSTGQPVSPFSSGFNAGRSTQQPLEVKRKPEKPVSPFDWK